MNIILTKYIINKKLLACRIAEKYTNLGLEYQLHSNNFIAQSFFTRGRHRRYLVASLLLSNRVVITHIRQPIVESDFKRSFLAFTVLFIAHHNASWCELNLLRQVSGVNCHHDSFTRSSGSSAHKMVKGREPGATEGNPKA